MLVLLSMRRETASGLLARSNSATFCGLPSSSTVKSSAARSVTYLPPGPVAVTLRTTRSTPARNGAFCPASTPKARQTQGARTIEIARRERVTRGIWYPEPSPSVTPDGLLPPVSVGIVCGVRRGLRSGLLDHHEVRHLPC